MQPSTNTGLTSEELDDLRRKLAEFKKLHNLPGPPDAIDGRLVQALTDAAQTQPEQAQTTTVDDGTTDQQDPATSADQSGAGPQETTGTRSYSRRLWRNGFDEFSEDEGVTFVKAATVTPRPEPAANDYALDQNLNDWVPFEPSVEPSLAAKIAERNQRNVKILIGFGDHALPTKAMTRGEAEKALRPAIPDIEAIFEAQGQECLRDRKSAKVARLLEAVPDFGLVFDTETHFDKFGRPYSKFTWRISGVVSQDYIDMSNKLVVEHTLSKDRAMIWFAKVGPVVVLHDATQVTKTLASFATLLDGGAVVGSVQRTTEWGRAALRIDAPDEDAWEAVKAALRATGTEKKIV